jgi:hypothetical protein
VDGSRINLLLSIEQPQDAPPTQNRPVLYDKVRYALDCLQGDYNTKRALKYIADVYQYICCIPEEERTPLQHKVMRMLIPELEIHAPYILTSAAYMEYKEDRDATDSPKIDERPPARKR